MARIYAGAREIAQKVDYINPHGAGTRAGDPVEIKVIRDSYGDKPYVNSTKAYTGHAMESAFLQEMMHTLVQMKHGFVAKTLYTTEIAEDCKGINLVLNAPVQTTIKRAICHNLGLGGVNALAILEKC